MYAAFCLFIITPLNQPITIDKNTEKVLVSAARKELAYLEQFGRPLLPFRRERRDGYQYQEQSPSDHIENLNRYLRHMTFAGKKYDTSSRLNKTPPMGAPKATATPAAHAALRIPRRLPAGTR